ncbi:hypothetical protein V6N12_074202 [Hibiscus sabdariffa]|uniref:Uncharacterized protein n=1 Tax=Hibiscus sabdariffa TaxID=183260 RepID=A0ABR2BI82_9ROSI
MGRGVGARETWIIRDGLKCQLPPGEELRRCFSRMFFDSKRKILSFSDTYVALRIMRAQTARFPQIDKVAIPPFTSVKNKNQVDKVFEAFTSAEDGMGFGDFDFHHKWDVNICSSHSIPYKLTEFKCFDSRVFLLNSSLFQTVDDKRDDVGPLEKCFQLFPLDMRFHLHDLVGSDHLKTAHTPTSVVVRVSKDLI